MSPHEALTVERFGPVSTLHLERVHWQSLGCTYTLRDVPPAAVTA